jgi:hypothetical protein
MIAIAIYSDKTVFTDYKNAIINQYAAWEEDLNSREEDLNSREEDLNNRERLLKDTKTNQNGEDLTVD